MVAVRQLVDHYGKSPDRISEEEPRQYFLYLTQVRKVSPSTFQIALSAIKFFYKYILQRQWATLELVKPIREQKLPVVLSIEEGGRFLPVCTGRATGSARVDLTDRSGQSSAPSMPAACACKRGSTCKWGISTASACSSTFIGGRAAESATSRCRGACWSC
jgi:hypothetical protein